MSLGQNVEEFATRLSRLVELHLKLARLEVAQDAKQLLAATLGVVAVIPLAIAAYALLLAAAVGALHRVMPLDLALLVVGVVNLVVALAVGIPALRTFQKVKPLEQTREELAASVDQAKELPEPRPGPLVTTTRQNTLTPATDGR